jgi:hypothetical protein
VVRKAGTAPERPAARASRVNCISWPWSPTNGR